MTIKHRLNKLEGATDNSTVCVCFPQRFETYTQDLSANAATNEPVLTSEPVPDVCAYCLKPTEKNSLTVQFVDGISRTPK